MHKDVSTLINFIKRLDGIGNKSTLIKKVQEKLHQVSHSSQQLRIDNIRGSINGPDIIKEFNGLKNAPENFERLFSIHAELGFSENLPRLVEATTNISPSGIKFLISKKVKEVIETAPERAVSFIASAEYRQLKSELDEKINQCKAEILKAGFIENVKIRG